MAMRYRSGPVNYKTYTATVELVVHIKNSGLIVQDPESVASAVRHMVRTLLPQGWRKNGLMFNTVDVHTEAKEKEVAPSFEMLNGDEQRGKP